MGYFSQGFHSDRNMSHLLFSLRSKLAEKNTSELNMNQAHDIHVTKAYKVYVNQIYENNYLVYFQL